MWATLPLRRHMASNLRHLTVSLGFDRLAAWCWAPVREVSVLLRLFHWAAISQLSPPSLLWLSPRLCAFHVISIFTFQAFAHSHTAKFFLGGETIHRLCGITYHCFGDLSRYFRVLQTSDTTLSKLPCCSLHQTKMAAGNDTPPRYEKYAWQQLILNY